MPTQLDRSNDFRGDLAHLPVPDLLRLLSESRRSGTLFISTPVGSGEVRLFEGEIVDALYRRLEGQKALFRLIGERGGSFSFASGAPPPALFRRITLPARSLLTEGLRQSAEVQRLRLALDLENAGLVASADVDAEPRGPSELVERVLGSLVVPRTLGELLDELPALDLEILEALSELLEAGIVRRIAWSSAPLAFTDPERLRLLEHLSQCGGRAGFRGAPRVAIAGSPRRLFGVLAALRRITEAVPPSEPLPTAPIPHVLASLRLGERADLDVLGLPLMESYAPLWGLVIPSCSAIAQVDEPLYDIVEQACTLAGVPFFDARTLFGGDEGCSPERLATLLARLIESSASSPLAAR